MFDDLSLNLHYTVIVVDEGHDGQVLRFPCGRQRGVVVELLAVGFVVAAEEVEPVPRVVAVDGELQPADRREPVQVDAGVPMLSCWATILSSVIQTCSFPLTLASLVEITFTLTEAC